LGLAQLEKLPALLAKKRKVAQQYQSFFSKHNIACVVEMPNAVANNWLNCLLLADDTERNTFLEYTNNNGVMTRPVWRLMSKLEMFNECQTDGLENAEWIAERLVNIPSSASLSPNPHK
jgi:perosamine synthetase